MKQGQAKAKPAQQASGAFELIDSPNPLKERVAYKTMGPGSIHPVDNAERHVDLLKVDFQQWLEDDRLELLAAWQALKEQPVDPVAFLRLHRITHTIFGNAAMLDREIAGQLAMPLSRLLERTPDIEDHIALIDSAVDAIAASIVGKSSESDEKLQQILEGLNQIVNRWITRQR